MCLLNIHFALIHSVGSWSLSPDPLINFFLALSDPGLQYPHHPLHLQHYINLILSHLHLFSSACASPYVIIKSLHQQQRSLYCSCMSGHLASAIWENKYQPGSNLNSSLNTINSLAGPTPVSEHYSEVSRVIQLSTFSIAVRHVQEGVGWAITNQEDAISETPPNSSSSLSSYNSSSSFLFSWTSHLLKCRTRHCRDKNVFPHLRISTEKFQNGRVT